MKHPKFILTNTGYFRFGMVNLHMHLLQGQETCYGGGYYEFDYVSNRLLLSGASYDFGQPRWRWLDTLKVPSSCRGLSIIYRSGDAREGDFNVSEEMNIEYYD